MVACAALAQLTWHFFTVTISAEHTFASLHTLGIVSVLSVAREAPIGAAVRGRARLKVVRAQLPPRTEPVGRVCACIMAYNRPALRIIGCWLAETTELALVLAALGLDAVSIVLRAMFPTGAQPALLVGALTTRHWSALRIIPANPLVAAEIATCAAIRVYAGAVAFAALLRCAT